MSTTARLAGKVHKWLALLMAVQILFWFASGLFFAIVPIEWVRSEHQIAEQGAVPVRFDQTAAGLQRLAAAQAQPAHKIELRALLGRPVALLTDGGARPRLYDLATGTQISPLSPEMARAIAETDHAGETRARGVTLVTDGSPEYRGALPAWRVDFDDGADRALYVTVDSGAVAARRSTLWRVYDFLWSLHIMDFRDHEDFNTPLLVIATALALIMVLTGFILFPSRLGYNAWKRRRQRERQTAQ